MCTRWSTQQLGVCATAATALRLLQRLLQQLWLRWVAAKLHVCKLAFVSCTFVLTLATPAALCARRPPLLLPTSL